MKSRSIAAAVIAGLAAVSVLPAPSWARPRPPGVLWHECADDVPGVPVDPVVECGTLTLPVDHLRPRGATFGLAVARRPARVPAERVGTLVFGPGGPGDSGVERIRRGNRFSSEILDRFDTVSFDPRGVGRSAAPVCAPDPAVPGALLTDVRPGIKKLIIG